MLHDLPYCWREKKILIEANFGSKIIQVEFHDLIIRVRLRWTERGIIEINCYRDIMIKFYSLLIILLCRFASVQVYFVRIAKVLKRQRHYPYVASICSLASLKKIQLILIFYLASSNTHCFISEFFFIQNYFFVYSSRPASWLRFPSNAENKRKWLFFF